MQRHWKILPPVGEDVRATFPELDPLVVQLLVNRGQTTQELVDAFLRPDYSKDTHDPFAFRDMRKAVDRIKTAMTNGERIMIFGDYDVDGVSSVAVLVWTFRDLHVPNVAVYLPDRYAEGYGLNMPAVERFAKDGVTLLITCDCGTSNVAEIARANELGMDVLVLDHHKKGPELPAAYALLNSCFADEPYPFKKLCATGVAFKLATALFRTLAYGKRRLPKPLPVGWEKWLLDLVALATVADLMPLTGENRTLVQHGLTVLRKSRRAGLHALSAVMGTPLLAMDATAIGYQIAPRLNAAGRLKHANAAFALLTTEDPAEAAQLASELQQTNAERQQMTERLYTEALQQVPAEPPLLIAAVDKTWPSGVVGLVAGKLKEAFHRPALAIGWAGERFVGSGRSISAFDITAALVEAKEHLAHFGGHPMACGFTLRSADALAPFLEHMRTIAARELGGQTLSRELVVDADIPLEHVDWPLADALAQFAPFGIGVPEPTFVTRNLCIVRVERMGKDRQHVRLLLTNGAVTRKAVAFGVGQDAQEWRPDSMCDVVYRVLVNEWNGSRELQLKVLDLRVVS